MKSCRRIIPAGAMALAALAGPAHAQSSDAARIKELEQKLERSLEMIDKLSAKVSQLEQATARANEAQAQNAQQAARIEAIDRHVSDIGSSLSRRSADDGLPVHGFADVKLVKSGQNDASIAPNKGAKGAALGNFDLYLTPQFGSRVKALVELNFEVEEGEKNVETDVERMQIGYSFSDAATGWLGRFHTPYGYWNTAFHHGAQIQTSLLRPRFLDFEDHGGILPGHTTGGWLTGVFNTEPAKLGYDAYLGNAPRIGGVTAGSNLAAANPNGFSAAVNAGAYAGTGKLDMRQGGSGSHRSSVGFNAWIEPRRVDGLRLGIHGLRAEVVDDAATPNVTRLNMAGGYFVYAAEPWEALGEYYRFRNRDLSGDTGTHASWAGFAQIGYNLGNWTPYLRAERTRLDQSDNYFGVLWSGRSYRRAVAGLRYDVDPRAALKVELNGTRMENLGIGGDDKYPELRLQYAIRF